LTYWRYTNCFIIVFFNIPGIEDFRGLKTKATDKAGVVIGPVNHYDHYYY